MLGCYFVSLGSHFGHTSKPKGEEGVVREIYGVDASSVTPSDLDTNS